MVEPSLWSMFRQSHWIVQKAEGPNDGLVSVGSSRWGEYKGTLQGVNHLDLINWTNRIRWLVWQLTGNKRKYALTLANPAKHVQADSFLQLQRNRILPGYHRSVIYLTKPAFPKNVTDHEVVIFRYACKGRLVSSNDSTETQEVECIFIISIATVRPGSFLIAHTSGQGNCY